MITTQELHEELQSNIAYIAGMLNELARKLLALQDDQAIEALEQYQDYLENCMCFLHERHTWAAEETKAVRKEQARGK